jgi:hypothetical protein
VWRMRWQKPSSTAAMIAITESPDILRKRASANVSWSKIERSSSFDANEKNRFEIEKTVSPIVLATVSSWWSATPAIIASVVTPMTTPAVPSQMRSGRVRIGCSDGRGLRSIRPSAGRP